MAVLLAGLAIGSGESVSAVEPAQVVDLDGNPIPHAVVFLEGAEASAGLPPEPTLVDQIDKQFVPRISVVRTGTTVVFPNSDDVSHHVYSFADPNNFELSLYGSEERRTVTFRHAGLVTLGCNIHDSMLGYILVVDTPYFVKTDINGEFAFAWEKQLTDTVKLRVWSPELGGGQIQDAFRRSPRQFIVAQRRSAVHDRTDGSLDWSDY